MWTGIALAGVGIGGLVFSGVPAALSPQRQLARHRSTRAR